MAHLALLPGVVFLFIDFFFWFVHKVVIVSNSTKMLSIIGQVLKSELKVDYFKLDGQTPAKDRFPLVQRFNGHAKERVFLLSSKAGGCGLNLIGANRLIMYDPDWNPANDNQAMARVWRQGQTKKVFIYRLL